MAKNSFPGKKIVFSLFVIFILIFAVFVYASKVAKPENTGVIRGILSGDCNTDGKVDIIDFQLLSNSFGKAQGQTGYFAGCDFNGDNAISILDYQSLSNNFGRIQATPTLPLRPTGNLTATATTFPLPTSGANPVVMANSDIICTNMGTPSSNSCNHMAVSQIIVNNPPNVFLAVGDLCHDPTSNCIPNFYNPSYGRFKSITRPVTGNHEYLESNAVSFFNYFNGTGTFSGPAGDRDKGYYSFDLGTWHLVALNSQCSEVGGCGATSTQYKWLENDLKTHSNKCTLAYYHIPLFSSGGRANNNMLEIFRLLYTYNAEIVLDGHDHIYERFAPQTPSGTLDNQRGIREFIVGTGGANHTAIASVKPNSEVRNAVTFGVLKLTLFPTSYNWQFIPVSGSTFTDSGSNNCH